MAKHKSSEGMNPDMYTATNGPPVNQTKSFTCSVRYNKMFITINVPTETRGTRTLTLDRTAVAKAPLTNRERCVLEWLIEGEQEGAEFTADVTLDELKILGSIKDKISGSMIHSPSTAKVRGQVQVDTSARNVEQEIADRSDVIHGLDATETRVNSLKELVKRVNNEVYVTFSYDIPDVKKKECPNPSHILWRHGFRWHLSVWILPKSRLDHPQIDELMSLWKEHGIEPLALEFSESQTKLIRDIAQQKLEEEMRRVVTSMIENIAKADETLKKAQIKMEEEATWTENEDKTVTAARNNTIRRHLRTAAEALNYSIACAEVYDNTERVEDAIMGLREAIRSQQETFNAEMETQGGRKSKVVLYVLPGTSKTMMSIQ